MVTIITIVVFAIPIFMVIGAAVNKYERHQEQKDKMARREAELLAPMVYKPKPPSE